MQRSLRLRAELERLRSLLADLPHIKQVIVFGSVAAGQTHEWSDLDLMIVEESEAPFIERSLRLARLVRPQVATEFLVYTPAEIRSLSRRPFVQIEILQKGKVLPMNPHEDARRWLEFAEQDLRTAEMTLSGEIFNQVCFHSQQCAEKCIKACLAAAGELLPRTHRIADLLGQLPAEAQAVASGLEESLLDLDQYYIPTRYPDALPGSLPEGLPQKSHAEAALAAARRCYEQTKQWLDALASNPD
jgi:HEPN domain-containing protein/predicted nucleotidyltransferase